MTFVMVVEAVLRVLVFGSFCRGSLRRVFEVVVDAERLVRVMAAEMEF